MPKTKTNSKPRLPGRRLVAWPPKPAWAALYVAFYNRGEYIFGDLPALVKVTPDGRIYWKGGPTYHKPGLDNVRLACWYRDWPKEINDQHELQYHLDFPITPSPIDGHCLGGWISPAGEFFAAPYQSHVSVAVMISAVRYGSLTGSAVLEQAGWIKVDEDDGATFGRSAPTQPQIDALGKLIEFAASDEYRQCVKRWMDRHPVA